MSKMDMRVGHIDTGTSAKMKDPCSIGLALEAEIARAEHVPPITSQVTFSCYDVMHDDCQVPRCQVACGQSKAGNTWPDRTTQRDTVVSPPLLDISMYDPTRHLGAPVDH